MKLIKLYSLTLAASFLYATTALASDEILAPKAYCTHEEKHAYIPINQRLDDGDFLFVLYHCAHEPSYLFGTIHSDNTHIIAHARAAFKALKQSSASYFEVIADENAQEDLTNTILDPKTSLEQHIGKALYARVTHEVWAINNKFPEKLLNLYKPWAVAMLLQVPKPHDDGVSLDEKLQQVAKKEFIPAHSLETTQEQFTAFSNLSPEENTQLLQDTLDALPQIRALDAQLEQEYLAGDMTKIAGLKSRMYEEIHDTALREKLVNAVLIERNNHFAQRIEPELAKGNQFIAVGVLHLPNKEGIMAQLEHAGYNIFPVPNDTLP
jgi:uncharacterized protein YbaP (TraB family)